MSKRISNTANKQFLEQIQSSLKKLFPTWAENENQRMVNAIFRWKGFIHQEDLISIVNETYLKIESKGKLNEPPGYFAKILKNKIFNGKSLINKDEYDHKKHK